MLLYRGPSSERLQFLSPLWEGASRQLDRCSTLLVSDLLCEHLCEPGLLARIIKLRHEPL